MKTIAYVPTIAVWIGAIFIAFILACKAVILAIIFAFVFLSFQIEKEKRAKRLKQNRQPKDFETHC